MASFKPGTHIIASYDPQHFVRQSSTVWRVSNLPARFAAQSTPDLSQYFRGGVANMLSPGALQLIIKPNNDRSMHLGGLDQVESRNPGGRGIVNGGINFRKRALNNTEITNIAEFEGYPVEIETSLFLDSDPLLSEGSLSLTLLNTNVVFRSLIKIKAWLGVYTPGSDDYPLVNFDGTPLRWPERLSYPLAGDVQLHLEQINMASTPEDIAALPAFASSGPSTFRAGALIPEVFGHYWYRLYQQSDNDDAISVLNAVSHVEVINSPGRIDADGTVQGSTFPVVDEGQLNIISHVPNIEEPSYTHKFGAVIVSSQVEPELRDELTGLTTNRSKQVVILDVSDRTEAGFGSTPTEYNASVFPDLIIQERGFFIVEMEETDTESILLTVSTSPGG